MIELNAKGKMLNAMRKIVDTLIKVLAKLEEGKLRWEVIHRMIEKVW